MIIKLPIILLISSIIFGQLPIELNRDQSYSDMIEINEAGEHLLDITCSSNTSWNENLNESSILSIFIDGTHNQDIILFNGGDNHTYKQSLGFLDNGNYTIEFLFDYGKSSQNANKINIENFSFYNTNSIDVDNDIFKYSPIIYGRNIFSETESNHTDTPLLMYYDISYNNSNSNKTITYGIIFSNEDSRVGIGLSDMMLSWGRTTDIEWVYTVILNQENEIIEEVFQAASHITTDFNGQKYGTHPYLINATANCNFSDTGTSNYKLFLSPYNSMDTNHTREHLMDQNPWTYKIMAQELINENKYEENQDPAHWELSDVRNYIYLEYNTSQSGIINNAKIYTLFYDDCYEYSNTHNDPNINFSIGNGVHRTAIELPENFNPNDLKYLSFYTESDSEYSIAINNINKLFYLSESYDLIDIVIDNSTFPIELNNSNSEESIIVNNENINYDCNGDFNGGAYCDDCSVCSGGNTDNTPNENIDDCGICFGNNESIDCNGICFGYSYLDGCNVCDNNPDNDGNTCSGCIDINAQNYDSEATIFNNSCLYSDRKFLVPSEYSKIQDAILFSSSGDTVLVEPGMYYEEIDFLNKGIALISTHGPEETMLIANNNINENELKNSVITIKDVVADSAILSGFTIQGGHGNGVAFDYFVSIASDPEIFNYIMYNSIKSGGISVINSSIFLSNLIIENNTAQNFGAGIGLVNSNSTLENITINNNSIADGDAIGGGAIAINGGNTLINNCTIYDNYVGTNLYQLNGGGGILCGFNFTESPLELLIQNTEIYNNEANIGAAIGALSGNIELNKVLIYDNTGDYGSAVSLGEPLGLIIDNINMIITNSTIANNNGLLSFGMIDNSNVIIANSILWNNGSFEFTNLPNNSVLNVEAFYSNINLSDNIEMENSISSNPLFIDYSNNNFYLSSSSPCINNGTNMLIIDDNAIINMPSHDYSGIMPDMGYFEFNLGDINGDNNINIFDVILLIENILYNQSYIANGDLDQNGINSIIDIISLINIILNL